MNDFEKQLTSVLRERSAAVPAAEHLAAAVHERRRRTARSRATWGTSVVVAAAVAGTFLLPALTSDEPVPAEPADRFADTTWIPDGWRVESYADLELAVPPTWGYGDFSCAERNADQPVFDRPGGARRAMLCLGPAGYGVVISDDRTDEGPSLRKVDADDVLRTTEVGPYTVSVVLNDAAVADAVIATVHLNEGLHANGCRAAEPVPPIGTARTVADPSGPISVCRYHVGNGFNLVQSERLDAEESTALRAALVDAPTGRGPDSTPDQCGNSPETEAVQLRTQAGALAWVHYTACRNNGIDLGALEKQVSAPVLHWALSPGWSGGFSSEIPFDQPRRLD